MLKPRFDTALVLLATLAAFPSCNKTDELSTPTLAASAIAPPVVPVGPKTIKLTIDPASKTAIDMPAPKEHIRAETTAAGGELTVDAMDLAKTRGQVKVDVTTLSTHTFGDPKQDGSQTEHAHNWLEAGDLVSAQVKEANRWVIFTIREVTGVTEHELAKVAVTKDGADDVRVVAATVKGDFFLHGHSVTKEAPVEVVFHYASGTAASAPPTRVEVRTKTPLHVVLAEHDVKPRDTLGKLAQASLTLISKVAETADVTFDLSATPVP